MIAVIFCAMLAIGDGDTVRCNDTVYRIVGMNAPETHAEHSTCPTLAGRRRETVYGREVAVRFQALANGAEVHMMTSGEKDRYGRTLGELYINGVNWAETAVARGWAEPYTCVKGRCPKRHGWCE